jgi:hypothetical protein
MSEYIKKKEYGFLIGKRARFKKDLPEYGRQARGRTGTIGQLYAVTPEDLEHIGLSLIFDKPIRSGYKGSMKTKSLYITPESFELIRSRKKRG